MPTIADVAKRAGVSTYTVSAVLNRSARVSPELTKRVQDAVKELDYTINSVARSLQTRKTQTIGMLLPDIANPFFAKVVRGVEEICKRENYSLLLGCSYDKREEQSRYLDLFRSRQVDGLLVFMAVDSEDDVARFMDKKIPVVCLGRRPATLNTDWVAADNRLGARLAVDYLISKGHKRIAIMVGQASLPASKDRVEGWRQSLKKHNIPIDKKLVCYSDWTAAPAEASAKAMLETPDPPTAFFVANLLMMMGVRRALREKNIAVPQQVELVNSGDSDWLEIFDPSIATVLQPSYDLGVKATELLFRKIQTPGRQPESVVLKPTLKAS